MSVLGEFGGRAAWLLAGALALYLIQPDPPDPRFDHVIVSAQDILEGEPEPEVRWRDRIVYRTPTPRMIADAIDAGQLEVDAFCAEAIAEALGSDAQNRPLTAADPAPADSPAVSREPVEPVRTVPERRILLRSGRVDPSWWPFGLGEDELTLVGPLSDGTLRELTYDVRPGYSWRASGDTLVMRVPRTSRLKQIGRDLLLVAGGMGLCEVGISVPAPF